MLNPLTGDVNNIDYIVTIAQGQRSRAGTHHAEREKSVFKFDLWKAGKLIVLTF